MSSSSINVYGDSQTMDWICAGCHVKMLNEHAVVSCLLWDRICRLVPVAQFE